MFKITTERLIVRSYTPDDAPLVHRALNNKEMVQYMRVPHPLPQQHTIDFIHKFSNDTQNLVGGIFCVDDTDSETLVGGIGLHNSRQPAYELGYWIAKDHWGKGYAYEASFALLRYAVNEKQITDIISSYDTRNPKSGRILQKLGFEKSGTQMEVVWKDRTLDLIKMTLNPILFRA